MNKNLRLACSCARRTPERFNQKTRRFSSQAPSNQSRGKARWFGAGALVLGGAALIAWPTRHSHAEAIEHDTSLRSTIPLAISPKPRHDISEANIQAAKREFIAIVGESGINESPGELKSRSSTEWSLAPTDQTASLIVFPRTTEEVSQVMKICHARDLPVTPFSGGTSLDGALAATRGGIVVDFSKMDQIIELRKDDMDVTVGPAVGWEHLNAEVAKYGFFFPPDPGPGAQIGGMIATGCSGTNAYRYGPMKDWVISTTVVLADGTIVKTRQRPRKSTAGYDLTRLIVGSSGTLGLVTEATVKLTALPANQHVAVAAFPTTKDAVNTVVQMIQTGLQIEAIELLDTNTMRAANSSGYTDVEYTEAPTLFMKFAGNAKDAVQKQLSLVEELAKENGSASFQASDDPATIEGLWSARKTALWNLIAQKRNPDDKFLSCDVAVPISKLAEIIEQTHEMYQKANLLGSTLGHVGDGNFHASVVYSQAETDVAENLILEIRRRGIELEGTVTGEHGVGLTLRDLVTEELGENATDMMRKIKLALDPKCILACDKVVRMEEGDEH